MSSISSPRLHYFYLIVGSAFLVLFLYFARLDASLSETLQLTISLAILFVYLIFGNSRMYPDLLTLKLEMPHFLYSRVLSFSPVHITSAYSLEAYLRCRVLWGSQEYIRRLLSSLVILYIHRSIFVSATRIVCQYGTNIHRQFNSLIGAIWKFIRPEFYVEYQKASLIFWR